MIELTAEQIRRAQSYLGHIPGAVPRALVGAINRAAESTRTEASRKVREIYYVKHKDIISTIKIKKASPENLMATVTSSGNLLPLAKFRVTPQRPQPRRKSPVVIRVKRGAEGGSVKNVFVARMRSGHIGVFGRVGKSRLPIQEKYGPSIPQMLGNPTVSVWIEEKAVERLEQRLDHEISRILGGK